MSFTKMDFDEYDVIQVKKRADVRDADLRSITVTAAEAR